eukprot:COSAG06_NODE_4118_length_4547_cov_22.177633_5_plen_58_part_00
MVSELNSLTVPFSKHFLVCVCLEPVLAAASFFTRKSTLSRPYYVPLFFPQIPKNSIL